MHLQCVWDLLSLSEHKIYFIRLFPGLVGQKVNYMNFIESQFKGLKGDKVHITNGPHIQRVYNSRCLIVTKFGICGISFAGFLICQVDNQNCKGRLCLKTILTSWKKMWHIYDGIPIFGHKRHTTTKIGKKCLGNWIDHYHTLSVIKWSF